jgi:HEPN domain-containing protein
MRYELHDLRSRLDDELNEEQFLHVPAYLLKYYSALDLFGLEIAEAFISLNEDLENAGKCLAVGQPTACIFHLMRAMEGAVQALCVKLSITNVEREWGKLLSDLHKAIEQMPKSPGRDEWSQVHANLYHVKQAWRNDTMHPKQTYTSEQAEEIFEAVRIFLRQLAGFV